MIEAQTIESKVRDFIYHEFPLAKKRQMQAHDSLLESGIVDSIGILDIVRFVEQTFSVQVSDEDLVPENFGSIAAIAGFVQQKLGSLTLEQEKPCEISN